MAHFRRVMIIMPALTLVLMGSALIGTAGAQSSSANRPNNGAQATNSANSTRGVVDTATPDSAVAGTVSPKPVGSPVTLHCGAVITVSTALANNIGPCKSGDGLIIKGSNISVDLRGHTVTGSHQGAVSKTQQVGIDLRGVTCDTVANGTLE